MHHDAHGHDAGAEAVGAMSWLIAMVAFVVLMVFLVVALFAWAPWDDNGVFRSSSGTNTERNVNPGNNNTQPSQAPQSSP
jgi:uncharacterized membrane protein